jgi:hypothetical protein
MRRHTAARLQHRGAAGRRRLGRGSRGVRRGKEESVKIFFAVAAALTLMLGVAWTLFPASMLSSWDMQANVAAIYMGRRYGGLFFGYALILWLARGAESSTARRAVIAGGALVTLVMAALSLFGILTSVAGPGAWAAALIEVLLAAGFLWCYLAVGGCELIPGGRPHRRHHP